MGMNAEIIAVGTELLLGDIVNTNAQAISQHLAGLGIGVFFQTVVGDNPGRIRQAFKLAFDRADIVITTGGLGPTEDDLTKEMAAEYFGKQLVLDQTSLERMTAYMEKQGFTMTENNRKQAYMPEGAMVLPNDHGTAPGCLIEADGKIMALLPGPPRETMPMLENYVLPYLRKQSSEIFLSRTLRICGVGESMAESMLKELIDKQTNPTIAPYAKPAEVHIRLTARASNEAEAKALLSPVAEDIYAIVGDNIYGEDDTTLADAVVDLLKAKQLTIACAESCTGGLLTAELVNVPGVSDVLKEGLVTYSNEAKAARLGVQEATLATYGAVSKETAVEMAQGAAKTAGADIGVAITGVAGPDGGTPEKPVGLVWIALCVKGETSAKELHVIGNRQRIRSRTVVVALDFLRRALLEVNV